MEHCILLLAMSMKGMEISYLEAFPQGFKNDHLINCISSSRELRTGYLPYSL